ncbi:unnamed protein product, partial [Didymodactylos carnosus]
MIKRQKQIISSFYQTVYYMERHSARRLEVDNHRSENNADHLSSTSDREVKVKQWKILKYPFSKVFHEQLEEKQEGITKKDQYSTEKKCLSTKNSFITSKLPHIIVPSNEQLAFTNKSISALSYKINSQCKIRDVKRKIEKKTSINQNEQRLLYNLKELADNQHLSSYNVQNGSSLSLVLKCHGGTNGFGQNYRRINIDIAKFIQIDATLKNNIITEQLVGYVERILCAFEEYSPRAHIYHQVKNKLKVLKHRKKITYIKNKKRKSICWPTTNITLKIAVEGDKQDRKLTTQSSTSQTTINFSWNDANFVHKFEPDVEQNADYAEKLQARGTDDKKSNNRNTSTFEDKLGLIKYQLVADYVRIILPTAIVQNMFLESNELLVHRLNQLCRTIDEYLINNQLSEKVDRKQMTINLKKRLRDEHNSVNKSKELKCISNRSAQFSTTVPFKKPSSITHHTTRTTLK